MADSVSPEPLFPCSDIAVIVLHIEYDLQEYYLYVHSYSYDH